jgi:hypothetical protein
MKKHKFEEKKQVRRCKKANCRIGSLIEVSPGGGGAAIRGIGVDRRLFA